MACFFTWNPNALLTFRCIWWVHRHAILQFFLFIQRYSSSGNLFSGPICVCLCAWTLFSSSIFWVNLSIYYIISIWTWTWNTHWCMPFSHFSSIFVCCCHYYYLFYFLSLSLFLLKTLTVAIFLNWSQSNIKEKTRICLKKIENDFRSQG